jgi:hypothetical protein
MELMKGDFLSMMLMMGENRSRESQVHAIVNLGTDKALLRTQFKQANHAHQKERGGGSHHTPVM